MQITKVYTSISIRKTKDTYFAIEKRENNYLQVFISSISKQYHADTKG